MATNIKKIITSKKIMLPAITIILFVVSSQLAKRYAPELEEMIMLRGLNGQLVYTLVMMLAVIIAPFETLPLLPVAVTLWGPNLAAFYTIIGWTAGSLIAFGLSRIFGRRFIYRFTDKHHIREWGQTIPKKNIFWLVAFARFILPVDVISYAVGLFTRMHWFSYLLATLVGIIPFAYVFAYGSGLKLGIQIMIASVVVLIVLFKYHAIKNFFREWPRIMEENAKHKDNK